MHRALLVALALVALPGAAAAVTGFEGDATVDPGTRATWAIDGEAGDGLLLEWDSDVAVDLLVLQAENASVLDDPGSHHLVAGSMLNQTSGRGHVTLPGAGPWLLVADNTQRPAGGAQANSTATVHVSVAPYLSEVLPTSPGPAQADGGDGREAPTLWNTFLFDSWSWTSGGAVGFGGVALWAILILLVACIAFNAPLRLTLQLAGAVTAFVVVWFLLPQPGALTEIGLPALAGLAVAWVACRRVDPVLGALRVILVSTIVGAFLGDVLAYGLQNLWSDPGILVFGNRRFVDEIFTVPGFGVAGFVLFKVIPTLVHALDDGDGEGKSSTERGPMQADTFHVTCLRCRTEIKVDRSMKRFRVATDRFEFPCPNCQYWMEWADPNAKGSAAA